MSLIPHSKGQPMLEFFTIMMIVTGGVLACAFWIAVLIAVIIEINDALNPKPKQSSNSYVDLDGDLS